MKSLIIFLVLLSTYCYCEHILGGWSSSNDDNLHRDCLNRALAHIHGDQINNEIRSEASNLKCKTQIVNGLNIKCTFVTRGQKWLCSYYKSFVQTLETQLEQCKQVENEQVVAKPNEDKPVNEELEKVDEDQNEEQPKQLENGQVVAEKKEDKPADEALGAVNQGQKEEQPVMPNEDDDEEQPAPANKDEKEKQVGQESLIADQNEEDDEAKIDAMNQHLSDENANHEEEQHQ